MITGRFPHGAGLGTRRTPCMLAAALATVLVLFLGACANIPRAGNVRTGDVTAPDSGEVYVQAYGPSQGAAPQEIVNGFLRAQAAGVFDDYVVAKEYLTAEAALKWDPTVRTTVYSGEPTFSTTTTSTPGSATTSAPPPGDGSAAGDDVPDDQGTATPALDPNASRAAVTGSITLAASLSLEGVFTEASANATQDITFTLTRTNTQWRIDNVDNGTFVSLPNFTSTYRPVSLQFLSADRTYLVPDVRWYPQRNVATYAVSALLAGPVGWLRDSVTTAIPDGTTLAISAVSVDSDGEATVDLSAEVLAASTADRALLRAQVEATLANIPEVRSVQFQADGAALSMPEAAQPVSDPIPADQPALVADGIVGALRNGAFSPDDTAGSIRDLAVTGLAIEPARSPGAPGMFVVRSGKSRLAVLGSTATGDTPRIVLTEQDLLVPSVDRYGWIWTASAATGLVAVNNAGTQVSLTVPWLKGRTISALRVSRDGARIVVVSSGDSGAGPGTHVELAGVVRDKAGAPTTLGTAAAIGAPIVSATQVVWVDELTVAVLGKVAAAGSDTVQVVPLAGWTESQANIEGAVAIAAGRGVRSIYVRTSDGELFARGTTGLNWLQVASGITAVAYPG